MSKSYSREQLLHELKRLHAQSAAINQEKQDLELLLETTTEHFSEIENELYTERETILRLRHHEHKFVESVKNELRIAHQIQADFLPESLPQLPGWQVAAWFKPAHEVAGDFYDVFCLPDDLLIIVIADVCDKGVGAALFMSLVRTLIRVLSQQAIVSLQQLGVNVKSYFVAVPPTVNQPAPLMLPASTFEILDTVRLTNNYITGNHKHTDMFATLFLAVVDSKTGLVSYVNAGHDAPIQMGKGEVKKWLKPTGPVIGIIPEAKYGMSQVQLEPADILLAYTDGVTEAANAEKVLFSEDRLLDLLEHYLLEEPS